MKNVPVLLIVVDMFPLDQLIGLGGRASLEHFIFVVELGIDIIFNEQLNELIQLGTGLVGTLTDMLLKGLFELF